MLPEHLLHQLHALRNLPINWNGQRMAAPHPAAIRYASQWLPDFYSRVAAAGLRWSDPVISADDSGNVTLEWWDKPKVLTVYILPCKLEFLASWGTDPEIEMRHGILLMHSQADHLWGWFTSENNALCQEEEDYLYQTRRQAAQERQMTNAMAHVLDRIATEDSSHADFRNDVLALIEQLADLRRLR